MANLCVEQKLKDKEQAIMAKRRQNSWTALPVWKYNSSKINTEGNKLQQELPDENTNPKCRLNLKHAKKKNHQPAKLESILAKMSRSTEITKTTISGTIHDLLVITCWRWNFSRLPGHKDKINERTRGSRLKQQLPGSCSTCVSRNKE